jgi:hypothetical protein
MNEYEIISPRVGEPGAEYVPADGVNVDALVEYGFIKPKTKSKKSTEEVTENA